jgi:hypothetical protein
VFRPLLVCLALVLIAGTPAVPAAAQTEQPPATRAEALRQEREKKQQALSPNAPDGLQRAFDFVEDHALNVLTRERFYPKIGSLTTGSGFALGLGYRDRDLFKRRGVAEVWGAASFKKYWALQARAAFPDLAGDRIMLEATANLRDYPREAFFGIGPDANREDFIEYGLRTREFVATGGVRVAPALIVGGNAALYSPETELLGVDYLRTGVFVEVDYREPLNARRGGWYRVDFRDFNDRDGDMRSFRRTDIDLRQFIGFLADRRVIALRGFVSTSEPADGSLGMPFYLMPTLGGNDTLRGFRNYRFRGPHALLLQAEYRWELWSGLDAALFYDAGKVALERSDLDFKRLEKNYGFGFRFNTSEGIILRVDAAFGSRDGKHLHIVFGGVF